MIFVGRHVTPEKDEDEGVLEAAGAALGIGKRRTRKRTARVCVTAFTVTCIM